MRKIRILLLLLFTAVHSTAPLAGQGLMIPGKSVPQILKEWADPETVGKWTQAIRGGRQALAENRLAEAETFFRQAILACDRNASEGIHQCIGRLLLTEVFLEAGKTEEAKVQVDQLVSSLEKATRYKNLGKSDNAERAFEEQVANAYRYQVGGALYVRAARVYFRLGTPQLADPLFALAMRVFEQSTIRKKNSLIREVGGRIPETRTSIYPQRHLRVAEVFEAQCRFHLVQGRDEPALKSLVEGEAARKAPPVDSEGWPISQTEMFLDRIVAEPLDKSLLKRFLEDCAFYRFDDARIADLLDRQAALLRKVERKAEATAFERFAESLRKKPLSR